MNNVAIMSMFKAAQDINHQPFSPAERHISPFCLILKTTVWEKLHYDVNPTITQGSSFGYGNNVLVLSCL